MGVLRGRQAVERGQQVKETYVYTCRGEYRIPSGCIPDICHPPSDYPVVDSWRSELSVAAWAHHFDDSQASPAVIRAELKECGAWSDDELRDDDENRHRFLWVLAWAAYEQGLPEGEDGWIVRRIHR